MENRTLTSQDVVRALNLYRSLPAAVYFRGQTGYGLIVEHATDENVPGVDKVGPITDDLGHDVEYGRKGRVSKVFPPSGIHKPGYFFITGGERSGRRTLTAADVKKAVDEFKENQLWAVLRVTTGKGFKLVNTMPELVDVKDAEVEVIFELTHFGGRNIVPQLEVKLSAVQDPAIKWQSGFLYESDGNNSPAIGKNLNLTRILAEEEFASESRFERVWQDLEKEAKRLMLFHCASSALPRSQYNSDDGRSRIFLSQELTSVLGDATIQESHGYQYSVRRDKSVVVQKSLRQFELEGSKFDETMVAFVKECWSVYLNSCQNLTESQKRSLGKADPDVSGMIDTGESELERDERRSTDTKEQLIAWVSSKPGFAFEGWEPEKGKAYRLFQHRWGRGYRVSPAAPRYEMRIVQEDDNTASSQEVRIEYDGTEKVVSSSVIQLKQENRPESNSWTSELTAVKSASEAAVTQTRQIWIGDYREVVRNNNITWERKEKKGEQDETRTFSVAVEKISARSGYSSADVQEIDLSSYRWAVSTTGTDSDGEEFSREFIFEWEKLPKALQAEAEKLFPICSCGNHRYEAVQYSQCHICRDYRDCPRCGEKEQFFGEDRIAAGATCCQNCGKWYEGREGWIHTHLTADDLQKIRDHAQALLGAQAYSDLEGEYRRRLLFPLSDGTYTSKFDWEALERLSNLPSSGNELVSLSWWVICGAKQNGISTAFTEQKVIELETKLDAGSNIIAIFVRATDEVIAAVEELREEIRDHFEYKSLKINDPHPFNETDKTGIEAQWSEAGSGSPTVAKLDTLRQLREKLVDEVDEYRAELARERQEKIDADEIWPDVNVMIATASQTNTSVFCLSPSGYMVEPEDIPKGYKSRICSYAYGDLATTHLVLRHETSTYNYMHSEEWEVVLLPKKVTDEQRQAVTELEESVRRYFRGQGTGWDLSQKGTVSFTTAYSRDMSGDDYTAYEKQCELYPIDPSEYESWVGEDPVYGGVHDIGANTVVVGPHPRPQSLVVDTSKDGDWSPADDPKMAKKGWFLCPNGHAQKINNAIPGQMYVCEICDREYAM